MPILNQQRTHKYIVARPYGADLDTWGFYMLAVARSFLSHLRPLLMDNATFYAYQTMAVAEPARAPASVSGVLLPEEMALDALLREQERGRLEQEFLPDVAVHNAVRGWVDAALASNGR